MRLVVDEIRGKMVNEALAYLQFSKKHAALQIAKTLRSAVANAEHASREGNGAVDVDALYIARIVVNEGPKLKRFTPAAMGRATPVQKRTSHVEIELAEKKVPVKKAPPAAKTGSKAASKPVAKKAAKTGRES
jgi:large subunit ribosomal protein L22